VDKEWLVVFSIGAVRRILAEKVEGGRVVLSEDQAHHLIRVLRLRRGAEFEALQGSGVRLRCSLERDTEGWHGRVLQTSADAWESPLRLCLVQSLIKKDRLEWVLRKAVELGVNEIVPLISARTEIRLDGERRDRRMVRWGRILAEAVKQCGRARIPELKEPATLEAVLREKAESPILVLDEEGPETLRSWLSRSTPLAACVVFIGPEGGWDERDRLLFDAFVAVRVRLGPRILRAETASMVILGLLQYELGDLSENPAGFGVAYRPLEESG
jgi:16S rRNA (uracil1498-N3)-methyltransferase